MLKLSTGLWTRTYTLTAIFILVWPSELGECVSRSNLTFEAHNELMKLIPHYAKFQSPSNINSSSPAIVEVNIHLNSFSSISVVDMDFTADLLLRQRWRDPRLRLPFNYTFRNLAISYLKEKLWIPDLFFRNAKSGFLHTMTTPNVLLWLDSEGMVSYSQKVSVKFSCHMLLQAFPMDTQKCVINIGSYGYSKADLDFRWWNYAFNESGKEKTGYAISIDKKLQLNEFTLQKYDNMDCKAVFTSTGDFGCLEAQFYLERRFGFYLIFAYVPSSLVVLLSWLSYFIDRESVPARISLGLLCVLAMITHSAAILTQLPRVSYVKAIDVWLFVCLAFVVTSLLEFAIMSSINRKLASVQREPNSLQVSVPSASYESYYPINLVHEKVNSVQSPAQGTVTFVSDTNENKQNITPFVEKVDTKSSSKSLICASYIAKAISDKPFAFLVPILFALFNVLYWTYYLNLIPSQMEKY